MKSTWSWQVLLEKFLNLGESFFSYCGHHNHQLLPVKHTYLCFAFLDLLSCEVFFLLFVHPVKLTHRWWSQHKGSVRGWKKGCSICRDSFVLKQGCTSPLFSDDLKGELACLFMFNVKWNDRDDSDDLVMLLRWGSINLTSMESNN